MGRLQGFLELSPADEVRVLTSAFLLFVIAVGINVFSFSTVRSVLLRLATASSLVAPGTPSPQWIARIVDISDRHLPGHRTCLVRSLSTETLLYSYGYTPEHRIGVARTGDGVEAHSWIEYDDSILIGNLDDLSRYEPLPSLDDGNELWTT